MMRGFFVGGLPGQKLVYWFGYGIPYFMPDIQHVTVPVSSIRPRRRGSCAEFLLGLLVVASALTAFYWYFPAQWALLKQNVEGAYSQAYPCGVPETYNLGSFDKRFNISQSDFLGAVQKAQHVWEVAAGRPLFKPVDKGGALVVNLIYDDRQRATDKLRNLGVNITADKAGYDRLKAEHAALSAQLAPKKTAFDTAVSAHDRHMAAYEQSVTSWNDRGGAPQSVYEQLNAEKAALDAEAAQLNAQRDEINAMVDRINANVEVLNRLATSLNLTAEAYNGVSTSRGAEFEEGLFTGTQGSGKIDIYEFDNRDMLLRLLIHETGHSLGLGHVDDPHAVMYRLNSGKNLTLTASDIAELKRVCRLP